MNINKLSKYELYNIYSYLQFRERYKFGVINKRMYIEIFQTYKHPEVLYIHPKNYEIIDKYRNIKFRVNPSLYYPYLKDPSRWKNAYRLNLSFLHDIEDISMLENVQELNIYGCKKIPIEQIQKFKNKIKKIIY